MKRILTFLLMLIVGIGSSWADGTATETLVASTSTESPEHVYFIHHSNDSYYLDTNTAPTTTAPGKFAFFAGSTEGTYKIYDVTSSAWLKCSTITASAKNVVSTTTTESDATEWTVESTTAYSTGVDCYQISVVASSTSYYWNWYQGISGQTHTSMGVYTTGASGDAGSAWCLETAKDEVTLTYNLTDVAGNTYTGSYTGVQGFSTPTFTGVSGYSFTSGSWSDNTYTATITFPFNVSKENGTTNWEYISSMGTAGVGVFYYYVDGTNVKVQKATYPTNGNHANYEWAIYPELTGTAFSFKIKNNTSNGAAYLYTANTADSHNEGTVIVSSSASEFTYDSSKEWVIGTRKLSVNSRNTTDVQNVGVWTNSHYGTYNTISDASDFDALMTTLTTAYNNANTKAAQVGTGVGDYQESTALTTAISNAKPVVEGTSYTTAANFTSYTTALTSAVSALTPVGPTAGTVYYINSLHADGTKMYLYYDATNSRIGLSKNSFTADDTYRWTAVADGDNFKLQNVSDESVYIGYCGVTTASSYPVTMGSVVGTLVLSSSSNYMSPSKAGTYIASGDHLNKITNNYNTNYSTDFQFKTQSEYYNALQSDAETLLSYKDKVGYPTSSASTTTALESAKAATQSDANFTALQTAITNYKSETSNIAFPEDGKAYYIINGQYNSSSVMEANKYILYNNNNSMAVKAYSADALDNSCIWIVRKVADGYYALISATGNYGYIHWADNTTSYQALSTTYTNTQAYTSNYMHIAKIVSDGSNVKCSQEQLFGYLSLRGYRQSNQTDAPFIFKGASAGFDKTGADIVRYYSSGTTVSQYSTAVQFVEVSNYTINQATLKAPKKSDGKVYSTICLPYATKTPDGVTACTCSLNGTALHLDEIESGDIPASTGVVLIAEGSSAVTATLTPSIANPTAISANKLGGTLTETLTSTLGSSVYVLNGGQTAGIGFYPYSQTANIPAYKAYYAPTEEDARSFYLFGDRETTGIESLIEKQSITNGKFIQNGRIIVVKNGIKYNVAGQKMN